MFKVVTKLNRLRLDYYYWSLTFIEPIEVSASKMAVEGRGLLLQKLFMLHYWLF